MEQVNCEVVWYEKAIPFVIWHQTKESSRSYPSHWHLDLEIDMVFDGELETLVNGKCIKIREGDVHVFNSREIHSMIPHIGDCKKKYHGLTLLIRYDFLNHMIKDYDNIYFRLDGIRERQEIAALLYQIPDLYLAQKNTGTDLRVLSLVCEILNLLCEKCMYHLTDIDMNRRKDWEQIRRIIEYIHEHYHQSLQQQELAQKFYFSRGYFASLFKKYTGKTFKEYLTEVRMNESERMLMDTDKSILQIAQETGFHDERRFIETFKRYHDMTPGNYRKKCHNKYGTLPDYKNM